ncbi:sensor histidine kinase [Pendulispora albinea]|uniref:histidine kinase n=1 Tax=Pendulispora albinea TaxID=2741071 RepID=A0ABZ2LYC9_9BACT
MRIAPRLGIALGFVGALSTVGLGWALREERRSEETQRFDAEVASACTRIRDEVVRQAENERKLLNGECAEGALVDRAVTAMEAGNLDDHRLALSTLVPSQRAAFDLDALLLVTDKGEVLGADPRSFLGMPGAEVTSLAKGDPAHYLHGSASVAPIVSRCRKKGKHRGTTVALIGMHRIDPVIERLGKTVNVTATSGEGRARTLVAGDAADVAEASCPLDDRGGGAPMWISVAKPKGELFEHLRQIDHTVAIAVVLASSGALLLAFFLARSLSRPIEELASQAQKVASGEARPISVRGTGEMADLTAAFDRMLEDLEATRRRLAATSRVAAWREVARRVAHEVKNPLAPIRAAVETLRRLRARDDPAFDEYFDEATRTVLDEVHRIANIVTEFTRFARLPPPRPSEVDLVELVKQVATLQKANAPSATIDVHVRGTPPRVLADRDQIVQVATNLLQNALDAVKDNPDPRVTVTLEPQRDLRRPSAEPGSAAVSRARVLLTVADNGTGIAPEIAARLFEPYATTKPHGTGLGLAIAQRIAIEHDGELSYIGTPGQGAVFRLALPVDGPAAISELSISG